MIPLNPLARLVTPDGKTSVVAQTGGQRPVPGGVRAEDGEELAAWHDQREVVHGADLAEVFHQVLELDHAERGGRSVFAEARQGFEALLIQTLL